eukprot:g73089.t1
MVNSLKATAQVAKPRNLSTYPQLPQTPSAMKVRKSFRWPGRPAGVDKGPEISGSWSRSGTPDQGWEVLIPEALEVGAN